MTGQGTGPLAVAVIASALLALVPGAASAAAPCSNAEFRSGLSADLPDCRAYELVTPPDKHGNYAQPGSVLDGDHVLYTSSGNLFPDDPPFSLLAPYLATRSSSGWGSHSPATEPVTSIAGFSSGHAHSLFETAFSAVPADADNLPGAPGDNGFGQWDVYRRGSAGLELLSTGSLAGNGAFDAFYAGRSPDASHVLFASMESLEPEDAGRLSGPQLYERVDGETRVVAVGDGGELVSTGGAVLGGYGLSAVGSSASGGLSNAVSADGSRIFFESPCPPPGPDWAFCPAPEPGDPPTQVYVRENGASTTLVSASECARVVPVCEDVGPARFDGASADGSLVYFRTQAQLIDGDVDDYIDLYAYDVAGHELRGVSVGQQGAVDCNGVGVCGVTAVSDDGRRVYFVATGALGPEAVAGQRSLYVYDATADAVRWVAQLPPNEDLLSQQGLSRQDAVRASMSPDGSVLVFESQAQLTPDDEAPAAADVYMYDAVAEELACASCVGGGDTEADTVALLPRLKTGFTAVAPAAAQHPNRYVTDDGGTVVFQTRRGLVARDSNGRLDVYQWHDGVVSLLTSGTSPMHSELMGVSADGRDVYFVTSQRLVASDSDSLADVYDARIGGGVVADHPADPPTPCAEDGCQGDQSARPAANQPGSASLEGSGDLPRGARPAFRVSSLTLRQRAVLAKGGSIGMRVKVSRAGRVSVAGRARIGRRSLTVLKGSRTAARAGAVEVRLKLSKAALRRLRDARSLTVSLSVRFTGVRQARRQSLRLRRAAVPFMNDRKGR